MALSTAGAEEDDETTEDTINRLMEAKKLLPNAYTNTEWEKLSIFLNFLVSKLPAPVEEDLSKGILEVIDMDSYRVEKQSAMKIQLPDEDGKIEPMPTTGGAPKPEPDLDRLSNILKTFTSSGTSRGPMPTGSTSSSPRTSRRGWRRIRPTRTRRRTPISRTPASSTTRRWQG